MRLGNSWEDSCSPASSSDITRQRGSKTEYSECRTRTIKIRQEARRRRRWRHTSLTLRTGEKLAQGHYCVERRRGSMKHADTRNTGKTQRQTLAARNVSALSGRNEGENLHFISFFLLLCVSVVCSFWCLGYLSILVRVGGGAYPSPLRVRGRHPGQVASLSQGYGMAWLCMWQIQFQWEFDLRCSSFTMSSSQIA